MEWNPQLSHDQDSRQLGSRRYRSDLPPRPCSDLPSGAVQEQAGARISTEDRNATGARWARHTPTTRGGSIGKCALPNEGVCGTRSGANPARSFRCSATGRGRLVVESPRGQRGPPKTLLV